MFYPGNLKLNTMEYTKDKFVMDSPMYIDKYGWNVDIRHPDHKGFYAQVSGNTEEEAMNNAKLISKAPEMYEALKVIKADINVLGQIHKHTRFLIESLINQIENGQS